MSSIRIVEEKNQVKVNAQDITQVVVEEVRNYVDVTESGPQGATGPKGDKGDTGYGIAPGGEPGQVLTKLSLDDFDTTWIENYSTSLKHYVKNGSGARLLKGQAVYITGADGNNVLIGLASNDSELKSSKTLGLLDQDLATNQFGYVTEVGILKGLNTNGSTAGDPVWLGTNGNLIYGSLNQPYAPANLVYIGVVTRKQSINGSILIRVQNGYELKELHDLSITNPQNGQTIRYDSATGLWKNSADPSGTVSSIIAGTGLTGGTITTSGTIAIDTNVVAQLITSQTFTGTQTVLAPNATSTALVVKGVTSQSAELLVVKSSTDSVIAKIDANGGLFAKKISTLNSYVDISEENNGGLVTFTKQSGIPTNPGNDKAGIYFRAGTMAGTLRLAIVAGDTGDEITVVDDIPQTGGANMSRFGASIIEGGNA